MPKYRVEMHDGRKFEVEADSPPSEEEILAHLGADSGVPTPTTADIMMGRMGRDSNLKEGPAEPNVLSYGLQEFMQSAAHPQSATDIAGLLLPRPLGESLNLGAEAMSTGMKAHPEMTGVTGRIRAGLTGIADKWRGRPEPDLGSPFARGGTTPPRELPPAVYEPHMDLTRRVQPGGMTMEQMRERDAAVKAAGGFFGETPNTRTPSIRARGLAPPRDASAPVPEAGQPAIRVNTASLPEAWKPVAEQPAAAPLQQPRVDIGAEKVGRGQGLTKQQVRDQTAPILGEAQGAASPILPEGALKRIVDDVKALPRGSQSRLDYVARATSGKTQWQVENIRRTLEHLGLIVPAAAAGGGMLRDALLNQMSDGSSSPTRER